MSFLLISTHDRYIIKVIISFRKQSSRLPLAGKIKEKLGAWICSDNHFFPLLQIKAKMNLSLKNRKCAPGIYITILVHIADLPEFSELFSDQEIQLSRSYSHIYLTAGSSLRIQWELSIPEQNLSLKVM